jgi:hypothetical protein
MQPVSDVIYREVEGAYLLYHIDTDMIFGLNQTGSYVWQMLVQGVPVERISATLADEFGVNPAASQQDVTRFLEKLTNYGLITSDT